MDGDDRIALTDGVVGPDLVLSWKPAAGATQYRLAVIGPDGQPCWAWSGTTTSVSMRADDADPVDVDIDVRGSTWQVSGYDAAGVLVAVSDTGRFSS